MQTDPGEFAFMTQAQKDMQANSAGAGSTPPPAGQYTPSTLGAKAAPAPVNATGQPAPAPAPTNTTLAQDQAKAANQGKPGYDALGNPIPNYTPPATATPSTTAGKNTNGTYTTDTTGLNAAQADYMAVSDQMTQAAKTFSDTITGIQNGSIPLSASDNAQIDGLKNQYQQLIDQQLKINQGAMNVANVRGAQKGAAEYDMGFQANVINSLASAGVQKVANLQAEEASKVAQLTDALKSKDLTVIKDAYDALQQAQKNSQDNLKQVISTIQDAVTKAQEQQQKNTDALNTMAQEVLKSTGDAKLATQISGAGSMSAAIALAGDALQTSTDKDIAGYLFYKHQADATGVTPQSFSDWKAAQDKAALTLKQKEAYAQALGTAEGQAAVGGNDISMTPGVDTAGDLGASADGTGFLNATGLSLGAYNYLAGNTAALTRLPGSVRTQIMREAQQYALAHHTDVSTLQAQFQAYNEVVKKNVMRAAQTKTMAGEVSGSADALMAAIQANNGNAFDPLASVHGGGMRTLRATNILDLMAGKEVNNPFATEYRFQLKTMANDLAGYYAAARGAPSPELQDQRDAADVIVNGMNAGSVQAFKDAVNANEEKVAGVVNKTVVDARKQVWDLFGVGDKFSAGTPSTDSLMLQDQQQAQQKVNDFVSANPDKADMIANLYQQGYTDSQMAEYLSL